ncbi:MAG: helix-turn-helix transcriptional regulator, partial [Candidatus Ornithospirochaeta sp.]|nr:helix-turn-helix transcriptional regulator [Candidatus Ornithospirochaeta sp.]
FLASSSDIEKAEEAVIERFSCDDIKVFPYGSHYGAAFILSLSSRYAKDQNSVYNDISAKARSMIEHCIVDDCCASSIINGVGNLGNGYLDALNTMEYKHSNRIAEFLFYRDVLSISQNIKYSYCAEDGIDLINAIFEGRADDAIEIIRKVIKTNQSSGVSPRHMRYLLFSISNTVLKAYTKLEEQYGEEIGTFTLPAILQAKNIEVARIALEERVNVLSEYAVSLRNTPANADEGHYKAYRRALEIIETEYSDPVLNVSSIADKLGISIALLSKIFKKYHNMNISDYISRYRVEASKKLLLSCMPLNEIAEKCGFGSLRTYMRVFKKLEDVSPGVFRTINKEEF